MRGNPTDWNWSIFRIFPLQSLLNRSIIFFIFLFISTITQASENVIVRYLKTADLLLDVKHLRCSLKTIITFKIKVWIMIISLPFKISIWSIFNLCLKFSHCWEIFDFNEILWKHASICHSFELIFKTANPILNVAINVKLVDTVMMKINN